MKITSIPHHESLRRAYIETHQHYLNQINEKLRLEKLRTEQMIQKSLDIKKVQDKAHLEKGRHIDVYV